MGLFKGPMTDVDPELAESIAEMPDGNDRVTAPSALPEMLSEAFRDLQNAQSHLLRGNHRAAVEFAADAVNRIAEHAGVHGYASY